MRTCIMLPMGMGVRVLVLCHIGLGGLRHNGPQAQRHKPGTAQNAARPLRRNTPALVWPQPHGNTLPVS
ncbi:hypothetical protein AA18889_0391 [Acetobacter senegalensis DSM 18889]|nr:hypothetical protein AA18889_0391 [Acetobacter senegalensis DSM 18889]